MLEPAVSYFKSKKWPDRVAVIWLVIVGALALLSYMIPSLRQIIMSAVILLTIVMLVFLTKSESKLSRIGAKYGLPIFLLISVPAVLSLIPVKHPYMVEYPGETRVVDKTDIEMEYIIDEHFHIVSVGEWVVKTKWDELLVTFLGDGYGDRVYLIRSENEQQYKNQLNSVATNESYIKPILAAMNELNEKPIFDEVARVNAQNNVENFLQNGDQIVSINGESSVPKIIYWTRNPQTIPFDTVSVSILGKQELKMTKQLFVEKITQANVQIRSEFPKLDLNTLPAKVIVRDNFKGDSSSVSRALEVYQQLTGENLVKGRKIAATGGIQTDGRITAIGSLFYKYHGLVNEGFDVFVVPKVHQKGLENALQNRTIPKDMKLIYADTLSEVIEQLRK